MRQILEDFIDWCRENLEDSIDLFEDTDKTIERYAKYLKEQDEE